VTIAPFDPADLIAIADGLQLLPENAERIVRLEALAHAGRICSYRHLNLNNQFANPTATVGHSDDSQRIRKF
jgi:hypothetical protein